MYKRMLTIAITLLAVLMLALPAASPAAALGAPPNIGSCPTGKLVINVTEKVLNSSFAYQSYWNDLSGLTFGMIDWNRHIQAWEVAPGHYCAEANYTGKFVTIGGGSPGGTDPSIAAGIEGTFNGSYFATFSGTLEPNPEWSPKGNVGTVDYACVPEPDAFDCPGYVDWTEVFFGGSADDFAYTSRDWEFRTVKNGTFIQHLDTFEGDITD